MKRFACLGAIVAACAALVGCGTTHARTVTQTTTTTTTTTGPALTLTPKLSCPGDQATMNCVLQGQAPPVASRTLGASRSIYGVDFGWGGVSAAAAKAAGARFGASYLSTDASKNWTAALVNSYHAAGLKTVAVWESTATRAEDGRAAGVADAQQARSQAAAVGNTTRPILFAVDCDCAGASILPYFEGVHSVLGGRDDAYGGRDQVLYL
ncbi:MAG: glycoside hydrolase domain-containing protein, partial [Pseudonocardiaceae bacterium]